jgi:uncharacterized protein YlxW (UPF0749 family)
VLIRNDIVLIFGVDRPVLRRDVNLIIGELVLAEVIEEICVAGAMHVHIGEARVFVLRCTR